MLASTSPHADAGFSLLVNLRPTAPKGVSAGNAYGGWATGCGWKRPRLPRLERRFGLDVGLSSRSHAPVSDADMRKGGDGSAKHCSGKPTSTSIYVLTTVPNSLNKEEDSQ